MDEHNGWHAYRHICNRINLTSDLGWYARPDEDASNYLLTATRKQEIVRIIEEEYGVELTDDDKKFILGMKSPRQLCIDFPNRFNPRHYEKLVAVLPKKPIDGQGDKVADIEKA